MEDEFFGFDRRESDREHQTLRCRDRVCGGLAGCRCRGWPDRTQVQSAWVHAPARAGKHTPRRWAAEQPTGPQAIADEILEQGLPQRLRDQALRDQAMLEAEHRNCDPGHCLIAAQRRHQVQPAAGPTIRHLEMVDSLTVRFSTDNYRSSRMPGRGRHRPSRRLEEKRFPHLPKLEGRLWPKESADKAELRAELECLTAAFLAAGGEITKCPAETTSRRHEARMNMKPAGRPPIGDKKMTNAERQQRWRRKLKTIHLITKGAPDAVRDRARNDLVHSRSRRTVAEKHHVRRRG